MSSFWGGKQLGSRNLRGIVLMIVAQEKGLCIFSDCIIFLFSVAFCLFIFIQCSFLFGLSVCPPHIWCSFFIETIFVMSPALYYDTVADQIFMFCVSASLFSLSFCRPVVWWFVLICDPPVFCLCCLSISASSDTVTEPSLQKGSFERHLLQPTGCILPTICSQDWSFLNLNLTPRKGHVQASAHHLSI